MREKFIYLKRIIDAYVLGKTSQLTFWHGIPQINPYADYQNLGQYYQLFRYKAYYQGPKDKDGIPLLDYHGKIGKQYNPIAIAQYGLGHYNLCKQGISDSCKEFLKIADYLLDHLERNRKGLYVWFHHFDWDYRGKVKSPWQSGLAQGNGISVLVRAYKETGEKKYKTGFERAYESLRSTIEEGGCTYIDRKGFLWIEEIIRDPPTHILNGFMWALFGVYDLLLFTGSEQVRKDFNEYVKTLSAHLPLFDAKIWSYYDLTEDKMLTSIFYHRLHIVQLRILYRMTSKGLFERFAQKWYEDLVNFFNVITSQSYKSIFKLLRY